MVVQTPPPSKIHHVDHDNDIVSPTTTFDSSLGPSPTRSITFDDSEAPSGSGGGGATTRHTIVMDHKINKGHHGGSGNRSVAGSVARGSAGLLLSKPVMVGIVLLLITTTGGAGYFFRNWLKIPGLNSQIDELKEQVNQLNDEINRLSGEVDRLEIENNRYESLNNQLNQTVLNLENVSGELNATSIQLEWTADRLNETNQDLQDTIEELVDENAEYKQLNNQLNTTALVLADEVTRFRDTLTEIVLENQGLKNLTVALEGVTTALGNLTQEQNETLAELQSTLYEFQQQNNRMEQLNIDLLTVVGFLNTTTSGLDQNLEDITNYLANQIVANQVLVLESLENTYRQRIATWDCDYRDIFLEEEFGQNFDTMIDDIDFETLILPYLEQRVLSELCLDVSDFEVYIQATYPPVVNGNSISTSVLPPLTSNRLMRSVLLYSAEALDYYFPESNEIGISTEEWADASFNCEYLDRTFEWGIDSNNR